MLTGWKSIAQHFGVSVRTVKRWHYEHDMPVLYTPTGMRLADPDDLKCWIQDNGNKKESNFESS